MHYAYKLNYKLTVLLQSTDIRDCCMYNGSLECHCLMLKIEMLQVCQQYLDGEKDSTLIKYNPFEVEFGMNEVYHQVKIEYDYGDE